MADNPLLLEEALPAFDRIQPDHVAGGMEAVLAACEADLVALETTPPGDWASFARALEALEDRIGRSWGAIGHLLMVKNSPELRSAHEAMQPKVVAFSLRMGQSRPLYDTLQAFDPATLSPEQQRLRDCLLRDAELSGVGLDGSDKERFNAIQTELAEISTRFSNNVLDANKAFALDLSQPAEIDGLPATLLGLAAQNAAQAGSTEATPEAGPWRITLDIPCFVPFMEHSTRRDLREQLYRAYITRAAEVNLPLIERILALRGEMAALLGYSDYAALSLGRKMAGNLSTALELEERLLAVAKPKAAEELAELQAFAAAAGCDHELAVWDIAFWAERLRESRYAFTDEELRPYFPMPRVLDGLFGLIERIFAVSITAADGEAPVWHDDIRFFAVSRNGERIASFYLDPYSRPAEKRGGAWMNDCLGRRPLADGMQRPVAHLVCNGTPPVGGKPSLMAFSEVETLFHEMGHGLQHMLTQVDEGLGAGISHIEWDAVELPSQFMENWCYHRDCLLGMAKHHETGETLPDDLFEKIVAARNYRAASMLLRQVHFGILDLTLHSHLARPCAAATAEQVLATTRSIAERCTVIAPLPEDRFLCSFGHIWAGGYAAGYYSYKWAEVLSADAFAAFEEAGLDNDEALRAVGARFRDTVLARGGCEHPAAVFAAFRGRDPDPDALLRQCGLLD